MAIKIVVTGGAIIRDSQGRILMQKRSDYGDWGLPGGGMNPGETVEETVVREIKEETGLEILQYELHSIYSGPRMQYMYPDGNEVVFVMFLFEATADLRGRLADDGQTLLFEDSEKESLQLKFMDLQYINIQEINLVQKPVFEDLKAGKEGLLRS
ncbi:NUDIX domain-containing protein [Paenibacillus sp. N1-5-1-14]|uniref:NUDIX domain-containing protein n=1 Tax=Paenibacillus radicibacter TaxID=2972488 RepID=UPI002158A68F|nr:NUDIX domain-containing protein [Paenibacillus radicibacter]MCR8641287.1 NUDIX domain-containing protein [Paenibacillus radicibacter]